MYHLQGRAVGEIQVVRSWSYLFQHFKGSHIPVLELFWKLQPKFPRDQKNLLAHRIFHIPAVYIYSATLLGVQQALVHQLLDLLHLLDLLNAINMALDPI